jgi:hypothetical protein
MSDNKLKYLVFAVAAALAVSGCGLNPFGEGALGGLNIYANFAKAMEKPKAIEEEESGKEGSKNMIKDGVGMVARAKGAASQQDEPWLLEKGLIQRGDTLVYYEEVLDKPTEEDPDKEVTGRGEVAFGYSGTPLPTTPDELDTTLITDLYSFYFIGRETKNDNFVHAGQVCSLEITVLFSTSDVNDIKPGKTWFWAKNISPTVDLGKGDTASFYLDSLDDIANIQYGAGHFLDSVTGEDNNEGSRPFDFEVEVHHKNQADPTKPYHNYHDNEGVVRFMLAWGNSDTDSLHFTVNFYPQYERKGTIRKNGPDGPVLCKFEHNEKTGEGWVTYFNEDGDEIGS